MRQAPRRLLPNPQRIELGLGLLNQVLKLGQLVRRKHCGIWGGDLGSRLNIVTIRLTSSTSQRAGNRAWSWLAGSGFETRPTGPTKAISGSGWHDRSVRRFVWCRAA